MTDNDIIKALECHSLRMYDPKGACKECPYKRKAMCVEEAIADTIALINRQKAEIEMLETENRLLIDRNCELAEKGEKAIVYFKNSKASARTEAIKEFAERFLEIVHNNHYLLRTNLNSTDYGMFTLGIEQALNEAKEMVGET